MTLKEHLRLVQLLMIHLRNHKIDSAVIGGAALAFHGYERATDDIDLCTFVNFSELENALESFGFPDGFGFEVFAPSVEDPLGGVISIGETSDGVVGDVFVQIVNFSNPHRTRRSATRLVKPAIELAEVDEYTELRFVPLDYLVLLKLIAGSATDIGDVERLMSSQADDVFLRVEHLASTYGLSRKYNAVIRPIRGRAR